MLPPLLAFRPLLLLPLRPLLLPTLPLPQSLRIRRITPVRLLLLLLLLLPLFRLPKLLLLLLPLRLLSPLPSTTPLV